MGGRAGDRAPACGGGNTCPGQARLAPVWLAPVCVVPVWLAPARRAPARPGLAGPGPAARPARPGPGPGPRFPAQLRHGGRAPAAVHRRDVRAGRHAAPGGTERRGSGCRRPGAARGHRAEAAAAVHLRAGQFRRGRAAGGRALARPAGRGGLVRLEPVRRRATHHRAVGDAPRLRRAALGAARRDQAGAESVALGGTGDGRTDPGRGGRLLRDVPVRAHCHSRRGLHRPVSGRAGSAPRPGGAAGPGAQGRIPHRAACCGRACCGRARWCPARWCLARRGPGCRGAGGRWDRAADPRPAGAAVAGRGAVPDSAHQPGGRRRVRRPGRHAVRGLRQPADAGRGLECPDGPGRVRRAAVGGVAARHGGRAGRVPAARPGALAGPGPRRRGRAWPWPAPG